MGYPEKRSKASCQQEVFNLLKQLSSLSSLGFIRPLSEEGPHWATISYRRQEDTDLPQRGKNLCLKEFIK